MQVSVFCQEPHKRSVAHQTYPANQCKEPQLHKWIVPFALLKNPSHTEHIARDETTAQCYGGRMQIVHAHTCCQPQQYPHVHEGGEATNNRVAQEFKRERSSEPSTAWLIHVSAREKANSRPRQDGCYRVAWYGRRCISSIAHPRK